MKRHRKDAINVRNFCGQGTIRYRLKTPYRGGTIHVIFEPLDFIARLAALVPKPRVNLTCFHGVFAPNSRLRSKVTPSSSAKHRRVGIQSRPHWSAVPP